MFEWLTVLGGLALGTGAALFGRAFGRGLMVVAIAILAFVVTATSGEIFCSWAYFGLDAFQTAVAFGFGFLAAAWLRSRPSLR
jgi:hypothetical protein